VPGYHQNKKHSNTVTLAGTVPSDHCAETVEHPYRRVVAGSARATQQQLRETSTIASATGTDGRAGCPGPGPDTRP
jgi:hypothetical protein